MSQSLRDFPIELDQLVADMMAPTPEERPASVADARARLFDIFPGLDEMRLMLDGGATTAGRMRNPLVSIGSASQMGVATVPPTGSLGATSALADASARGERTGFRTAVVIAMTLACGVAIGGLFMRKAPIAAGEAGAASASGVAVTSELALGAAHERLGNADAARAAYASCARLAVGDRAHECVSRAAGSKP